MNKITVKKKGKTFSQFLEDDFWNTRIVSLDLKNLHLNFIPKRNIFVFNVIILEGNKRPCI